MRSMTAFAREAWRDESGELVWEVRSVNHRYLETTVRLPEEFRQLEPVIREKVGNAVGRGKLECGLRFKAGPKAVVGMQINESLTRQLLETLHRMEIMMHGASSPQVMDIARWPGVIESVDQDFAPLQQRALAQFDAVLNNLVTTREREGAKLGEMIVQRCDAMAVQVDAARRCMPRVMEQVKKRLRDRLAEVSAELDHERIEQEMALIAQRLDIDEELDRLDAHLTEVRRVVKRKEPVGRRLDFLMQELHREANTLGSKSADKETTAISVEMKVLIEQIREQVQNIE